MPVIAAAKRFPNECPLRLLALGEAVAEKIGNAIASSAGERDEAVGRTSPPGGRTPSSFCRRPEEPPSSLTVTTAVRLLERRLRPRSNVERPVPPPIATIL